MALRRSFTSILRSVYDRLFNWDWFRKLLRRMGLAFYLNRIYETVLYMVTDDKYSSTINGVTSTFHANTPAECKMHVHTLEYESNIISDLLDNLSNDDVFFDVGANVGGYTCFASALLFIDQVHAFEPHPDNAQRIKENLDLNDREAVVHEVALGDTNSEAELYVKVDEVGIGTHSLGSRRGRHIDVPVKRMDSLPGDVPRPTVVKIDVEGAELGVLRGMGELLEECRLVYCEVHPKLIEDFGHSPEEVSQFLRARGFETELMESHGEQYCVRAEKVI